MYCVQLTTFWMFSLITLNSSGAKIINQVMVGQYTIIGAGAVVSKDLPENCTAVGIPAKPIKINA